MKKNTREIITLQASQQVTTCPHSASSGPSAPESGDLVFVFSTYNKQVQYYYSRFTYRV